MKTRRLATSALDRDIAELASETDKKTLATWACDCVARVLPYFEDNYAGDERPRLAIKATRTWIADGVFQMAAVRRTALAAHAAAREVEGDDAARSAAHAAGQALGTTHVARHAVAAAVYAATAVRDAAETDGAAAALAKEREWQYRRLIELRRGR